MAEKFKSDEEPSIEDILDSIRQIISEDDAKEDDTSAGDDSGDDSDDSFAALTNEDLEDNLDESFDDDILDLTERAEDAPPEIIKPEPVKEMDTAPPPHKDEASIFIEVDLVENEPEPSLPENAVPTEPEIVIQTPPPPPIEIPIMSAPMTIQEPQKEKISVPDSDDESILSATAENAAYAAIAELARKTAVEHNGVTLEDIVRSEIKPMLRVWLDKNLPIVIERLVREELERVSKRVLEE